PLEQVNGDTGPEQRGDDAAITLEVEDVGAIDQRVDDHERRPGRRPLAVAVERGAPVAPHRFAGGGACRDGAAGSGQSEAGPELLAERDQLVGKSSRVDSRAGHQSLLRLPADARAPAVFFLRAGALAAFLRVVAAVAVVAVGARLDAALRVAAFFDALRILAGALPPADVRVVPRSSRRVSCRTAA